MGGPLVTKHVVNYCQRRARLHCICFSLHGKSGLTSCTLLTRRSASVLKVGMPFGLRSLQNKTAGLKCYTDACKEAARKAYESNPEKKKEAARQTYYVSSKR